jgi:hypothetical protein
MDEVFCKGCRFLYAPVFDRARCKRKIGWRDFYGTEFYFKASQINDKHDCPNRQPAWWRFGERLRARRER